MPTSGTQTVTSCTGTFTDSNASSPGLTYYSFNESGSMTFCSGTSDDIEFDFTTGWGVSVGDLLSIYDGTTTSDPLIGSYDSTSPGVVNSTNGCLHFVFSSDASGNGIGWNAPYTCIPPVCADGIQNGTETGIDCGGNCPDVSACDLLGQW